MHLNCHTHRVDSHRHVVPSVLVMNLWWRVSSSYTCGGECPLLPPHIFEHIHTHIYTLLAPCTHPLPLAYDHTLELVDTLACTLACTHELAHTSLHGKAGRDGVVFMYRQGCGVHEVKGMVCIFGAPSHLWCTLCYTSMPRGVI